MMRFVLMVCFLMVPGFSFAAEKNICLKETAKQERILGIKKDLLSTISLVETGRRTGAEHPAGYAWPWTVMARGEGRYFGTKEEAVAAVRELQAEGVTNIDVGCMQINLYYHGSAFRDLDEAFDPTKNTQYAARFLKQLYDQTGSWGAAATQYHSKEPEKAERYETKLLSTWKTIQENPFPETLLAQNTVGKRLEQVFSEEEDKKEPVKKTDFFNSLRSKQQVQSVSKTMAGITSAEARMELDRKVKPAVHEQQAASPPEPEDKPDPLETARNKLAVKIKRAGEQREEYKKQEVVAYENVQEWRQRKVAEYYNKRKLAKQY